jgi:hypothetical protein
MGNISKINGSLINADTASFVTTAQTASYVENAQTASFVNTLNQSVTITGAITASSNISASGYLVAQNITASGDISSSGNIYANEFYADLGINEGYHIGSGKPALSITDGGTLNLGAAHPTYMAAGVNIYTTGSDSSKGLFLDSTGNITASGNISASGYLVVQNITASGNISASGTIQSLDMRVGTSEQPNGIIRFGDPGDKAYPQFIQSEINQLKLERGNGETLVKYNTLQHVDGPKVVIYGDISASGYLVVQNITASNNISASGTIFGTFQQITGITVLQSDWTLDSGLYESDISNANITSNTVVDVIPDNAYYTTVLAAQLLPANVSSAGAVKIFAVNEPTDDIDVTLNLFK